MTKKTLIEYFQAGDIGNFQKHWPGEGRDVSLVCKSWLSWLIRDPAQRADKRPGDMIPGGVKWPGAMDAEIGPFLDIVLGEDTHHKDSLHGLAAWAREAHTPKESRVRIARVIKWLDRVVPGLSRTDASTLLGQFLSEQGGIHYRSEFTRQLMEGGRLLKWNNKALLRPEYLVKASSFRLQEPDDGQQSIALIDRILDSCDPISRVVRTDITPAELLKSIKNSHSANRGVDPVGHLLSRLAEFYKPEIQEQIATTLRMPYLRNFAAAATPDGLNKLLTKFPGIGMDETLEYRRTLGKAILDHYARCLIKDGVRSETAVKWMKAIDKLDAHQRETISKDVNETIEDMIDGVNGGDGKSPQRLAKRLDAILAIRELHPNEPLEARSWAELAVTGALRDALIQSPTPKPSKAPR